MKINRLAFSPKVNPNYEDHEDEIHMYGGDPGIEEVVRTAIQTIAMLFHAARLLIAGLGKCLYNIDMDCITANRIPSYIICISQSDNSWLQSRSHHRAGWGRLLPGN